VIGGFYISKCYCILCALSNILVVFNLVDFYNLPNCQNKFYTKISSYTVTGFKIIGLAPQKIICKNLERGNH